MQIYSKNIGTLYLYVCHVEFGRKYQFSQKRKRAKVGYKLIISLFFMMYGMFMFIFNESVMIKLIKFLFSCLLDGNGYAMSQYLLKGQCHEIFECWFFASNSSSWSPQRCPGIILICVKNSRRYQAKSRLNDVRYNSERRLGSVSYIEE